MRDPVTTTAIRLLGSSSAAAMDVPFHYSSRQARKWLVHVVAVDRSLLRSGNGRRAKLKESRVCFG